MFRAGRSISHSMVFDPSCIKKETMITSIKSLFLCAIIFLPNLLFCIRPITFIENDRNSWTLINSVAFHPRKNIFCVTFTQQHRIGIYEIVDDGQVQSVQMIENPKAHLLSPQYALFSADGNHLIAINWSSCSFGIYSIGDKGLYEESPKAVIDTDLFSRGYRPHGMALSSTGDFLAVAYGFCSNAPSMIALYKICDLDSHSPNFILLDSLEETCVMEGVPKGIAFSKDDGALIVSFSETDSLAVFSVDVQNGKIDKKPKQIVQGFGTKLSRPEEVGFSADGTCCAISNSSKDNVAFYRFDVRKNQFTSPFPIYTLSLKKQPIVFPHGIAFSKDNNYFIVTQFGSVKTDPQMGVFPGDGKEKEGFFIFDHQELKKSFHQRKR